MPSTASPFTAASLANPLLWLAEVLYLLGLVTLVLRRRASERKTSDGLDHLPAWIGFAAHLAALVARALLVERFPVGSLGEAGVFLAFLLAACYVAASARFRYPAVEGLLLALVSAFLALGIALPESREAVLAPSLASRWFVFHTLLSMLGVTALFSACVVSVLYLLADSQLKRKRPGTLLRFLPSLVACDRTALRLLAFGFPLLTLGLLSGWFWSRESGTWRMGPKEMWAMVAWLIYGGLLLARWTRGWQGRKAALLSVSAGAAALAAILGIRL